MADQLRMPSQPNSSSSIIARPEPIRANEFVDPMLLQSLTGRPEVFASQMPNFAPSQNPWICSPGLINPMQFDLRSLYTYFPAAPLKNPLVVGTQQEEKDRDSGNETSSISPGTRTPLTNSPSSIPSR
jgi:hypothetical protein